MKASGRHAGRDGFEVKLTGLITKYLGPAVAAFMTITFHGFDGQDVRRVTVEPSHHPIYCQQGEDNYTFFLRVANSNRPPPLPEVGKYVATRWGYSLVHWVSMSESHGTVLSANARRA